MNNSLNNPVIRESNIEKLITYLGLRKNLILNNSEKFAAVVIEPMNSEFPKGGFLEEIRSLCTAHGIVLIFDETLTGFRFSSGGAQKFFNVFPDISTFGKGIANGYPLSVITGKREIMREMEEIFFSGTFGGELLSLAAANKVLDLHKDNKVCIRLAEIGERIKLQVDNVIAENCLQDILELSGHPSWIFLNWSPSDKYSVEVLKTFFMQEMFSRGVLILNTHNISTSFNESEIKVIVKSYSETLNLMARLIKSNDLIANLKVNPLVPLFKVRGN
jgi:glutamate-1-semialdehyde 2,1-aminomutase